MGLTEPPGHSALRPPVLLPAHARLGFVLLFLSNLANPAWASDSVLHSGKQAAKSDKAEILPAPSPEPILAPAPAPCLNLRKGRVGVSQSRQERVDELLRRGMDFEAAGDPWQAEHIFHQVLDMDHLNVNAFYNLGVISEKKGDLQSALRNYSAAANLEPQDEEFKQAVASMQHKLTVRQAASAACSPPFAQTVQSFNGFQSSAANQGAGACGLGSSQTPKGGFLLGSGQPVIRGSVNQSNFSGSTASTSVGTSPVTRAVLGAAFRIGASAALGAAMGRGMGGLHCPMCRILGGGF